jgi:hypothetical protein
MENQRALDYTHKEFLKTKENFIHDRDTLSVYARQLGYGAGDEKFIRIKGLSVATNPSLSVGQVLYAANPEFITDKVIKIISACFGLAVLAFFLVKDILLSRINP